MKAKLSGLKSVEQHTIHVVSQKSSIVLKLEETKGLEASAEYEDEDEYSETADEATQENKKPDENMVIEFFGDIELFVPEKFYNLNVLVKKADGSALNAVDKVKFYVEETAYQSKCSTDEPKNNERRSILRNLTKEVDIIDGVASFLFKVPPQVDALTVAAVYRNTFKLQKIFRAPTYTRKNLELKTSALR
jgi:hypothetical protein